MQQSLRLPFIALVVVGLFGLMSCHWFHTPTEATTDEPQQKGILKTTGSIHVLDTPPKSVLKDQLVGEEIYIFEEFSGYVKDLPLDSTLLNQVSYSGTITSYYVHFDIGSNSEKQELRATGTIEFNNNVIGVILSGSEESIYTGNLLCATNDLLGSQSTNYGSGNCGVGNDERGLEIGNQIYPPEGTDDGLRIDGRTVEFSLRVLREYQDAARIIIMQQNAG